MPTNEPVDVFKFIEMCGPDDCWPWTGAWGGRLRERRPYFMAGGRRTMCYRWVWELVKGEPIPEGMSILHSCDNGGWPIGCSNPAHLSVGTVQENADQMKARSRHGLPVHVVRAIHTLLKQGRSQQEIADLYGVARSTISAISTQRYHKHVDPNPIEC
jgi:predicted XRE-type DNA-binding protein